LLNRSLRKRFLRKTLRSGSRLPSQLSVQVQSFSTILCWQFEIQRRALNSNAQRRTPLQGYAGGTFVVVPACRSPELQDSYAQ
jgi:hypothetical protein